MLKIYRALQKNRRCVKQKQAEKQNATCRLRVGAHDTITGRKSGYDVMNLFLALDVALMYHVSYA
jgi:hypothetical protein